MWALLRGRTISIYNVGYICCRSRRHAPSRGHDLRCGSIASLRVQGRLAARIGTVWHMKEVDAMCEYGELVVWQETVTAMRILCYCLLASFSRSSPPPHPTQRIRSWPCVCVTGTLRGAGMLWGYGGRRGRTSVRVRPVRVTCSIILRSISLAGWLVARRRRSCEPISVEYRPGIFRALTWIWGLVRDVCQIPIS